jgi:hypothetical protein
VSDAWDEIRRRAVISPDASNLELFGADSVADELPELRLEWAADLNGALTPETTAPNYALPLAWRCRACREVWQAPLADRRLGIGECPVCHPSASVERVEADRANQAWRLQRGIGAYPERPLDKLGIVYLVVRVGVGKVGIASGDGQRLDAHRRYGWATEHLIERLPAGVDARVERAVLAWVRSKGARVAVAAADMPQNGSSETFLLTEADIDSVRERINLEAMLCVWRYWRARNQETAAA